MANVGKVDRSGRITKRNSGAWTTVSQDLLRVAAKIFHLSRTEASHATDKNTSQFIYAGLPLLPAAI